MDWQNWWYQQLRQAKQHRLRTSLIGALTLAILFSLSYWVYSAQQTETMSTDPGFAEFITAHTSGVISKNSTIKIRLSEPAVDTITDQTPEAQLFEFNPHIEGKTYWRDRQTIEFVPAEPLPSNQEYVARFYLHELIDELPTKYEVFKFKLKTIKQSFEVDVEGLQSYSRQVLQWQQLQGELLTADASPPEKLEQILTASQKGRSLPIRWEHRDDQTIHKFTVDSIKRSKKAGQVILKWNGEAIGVGKVGRDTIDVPALGDFKITNYEVVQQPDQYVSVRFSDPLKQKQNIEGLIQLESTEEDGEMVSNLRTEITHNELRVYPPHRLKGTRTLYVTAGIRNVLGYELKEKRNLEVTFQSIKPQVKMLGEGVILPQSKEVVLPFKAVSLKAVDVSVIRIYQDNIPQFLQVNELDDEDELRRVGQVVAREKVDLKQDQLTNLQEWNRFSLDLSDLIKQEPGAIYRVMISFRRAYSLYSCEGEETSEDFETREEWQTGSKDEFWEYYYDHYPYGYSYQWENRKNPCHPAYFSEKQWATRNLLASNLGLLAKKGRSGQFLFAVTDLNSAKPVSGADLYLYDYQQQLIEKIRPPGDGLVKTDLEQPPFLVVAEKGEQRGYLRIKDGRSLSLSNFEVGGRSVQEGVKGFIYTERGVWRPGDSIHPTFILEDQKNKLPEGHPVTFKLYNPMGQLVHKKVKTDGVNGFYNFSTATNSKASTGNWKATVSVGGARFTKWLDIETIKPNRLKMNLELLDGMKGAKLSSEWLHGAPAKNLRAKVDLNLAEAHTSFENYEDYNFEDPMKEFETMQRTVFDDQLNENGLASFQLDLDIEDEAPGKLRANFLMKVFEKGGNFSIDRMSTIYSPFASYVGMHVPPSKTRHYYRYNDYYFDTTYTAHLVNVDEDGNPQVGQSLDIKLYKIDEDWWWENRHDEDRAIYSSSYHVQEVETQTVTTNDAGKANYRFKVDLPPGDKDPWKHDFYYLRIIDRQSNHQTGKFIDFDAPRGYYRHRRRPSDNRKKNPSRLTLSTDKDKYEVGEKVTLTIPSSHKGRALVSLETGTGILEAQWIKTLEGRTQYQFKTTTEMTPNIYAHVTLLQPHNQTENDLPIRMYGVVPVEVEDPNTHLYPQITLGEKLRPKKKADITVSEKNDRKMTYTLAIVDKGLLDLTNFSTPAPWSHFYAKEALGVKTFDLFEHVISAYGGELERVLSIGGGESRKKESGRKANRFEPVVIYRGPFELEAGEERTHTVRMPNYVGAVRTMVVAGQDAAYGSADTTVKVRKPLMVLSSLTRVLRPQEEVKLPVTVFAMNDEVQKVNVSVRTNELLELTGQSRKTVHFDKPGEKTVFFKMRVPNQLGIAKVNIEASSGTKVATDAIELNVYSSNPEERRVLSKIVPPGQQWDTTYQPFGIAGTNSGVLEVSSTPPLNLGRRLQYLVDYPHGCSEQIISGAFPQLFLADVMDLSAKKKKRIERHVRVALNKLRQFQLPDGGLSLWPGRNKTHDWTTSYAGHFILEAQEKGFSVPPGLLSNWKEYQKEAARQWQSRDDRYYDHELTQAYRLYTLALANEPALGAMNRMRKSHIESAAAQWRLATAYHLAGHTQAAGALVKDVTTSVDKRDEYGHTFGSDLRDMAMILESLTMMGKLQQGQPVLETISDRLQHDRWLSTQTTGFCLMAASKYLTELGSSQKNEPLQVSFNVGQGMQSITTQKTLLQKSLNIQGLQEGFTKLTNKTGNPLFARVVLRGKPARGRESAATNGIAVTVDYKLMDGTPINPSRIEQGTDFVTQVTVKHTGVREDYKEVALTHIIPSGWEVHGMRLNKIDWVDQSYHEYQDVRDDRIYTYFDLDRNETKHFSVLLNASYLGTYYLPSVSAEAMYDGSINGRTAGQEVKVVKPGEIVN